MKASWLTGQKWTDLVEVSGTELLLNSAHSSRNYGRTRVLYFNMVIPVPGVD
jgi:hypothetical protein